MPEQDNVVDLHQVQSETPSEDLALAIAVITQWRKIINARLLVLIALMGALAVYGLTMYDPSTLRLVGSGLYSMCVLWPVIALYLRKG